MSYLERLIELLVENDIAIMSHGPSGSTIRVPDVKRLYQSGVRMCTGNDGVRDALGPAQHAGYALAQLHRRLPQQSPPRR